MPQELIFKSVLCKPFPFVILFNECRASILPSATQEVAESRLEAGILNCVVLLITSGSLIVCFFILVEVGIF